MNYRVELNVPKTKPKTGTKEKPTAKKSPKKTK